MTGVVRDVWCLRLVEDYGVPEKRDGDVEWEVGGQWVPRTTKSGSSLGGGFLGEHSLDHDSVGFVGQVGSGLGPLGTLGLLIFTPVPALGLDSSGSHPTGSHLWFLFPSESVLKVGPVAPRRSGCPSGSPESPTSIL